MMCTLGNLIGIMECEHPIARRYIELRRCS